MNRFVRLLLIFWLALSSGQSWAEAGQLLFARGTVSIIDDNRFSRGASTGSTFNEGETVVTGARSIAQLRLSDGALLALRSNSEYRIDKQVFDEAGDLYEQAGQLVAGWMRSVTGAIGARRPQKVSQSTSVATIGVRGTAYQVIHVPEQGLAGFPGLAPGSYIYLEQGALEISSAGGSWMMRPGEVLEVPAVNAAPRLAPKLRRLFFGNEERDIAATNRRHDDGTAAADNFDDDDNEEDRGDNLASNDDDDRELINTVGSDIDDAVEDAVDNTLPSVFPSFSGDVGGVAALDDIVGAVGSDLALVDFDGAGANKFATDMEFTVGGIANVLLQAEDDDYQPVNTGSRLIRDSSGGIAAQVHWGTWLANRFTGQNDVGNGPELLLSPGNWHFMIADNVFTTLPPSGLSGTVRYNYSGGGAFLNSADPSAAAALIMDGSSYVDVNLGEFQLNANLFFRNGLTLEGFGAFSELFEGSIALDNSNGGQQTPTVFGNMAGAFVGEGFEGLISAINFIDVANIEEFAGTALFQRPVNAGSPASALGGVVGYGVLDGNITGAVLDVRQSVFFPGDGVINTNAIGFPFLRQVSLDNGDQLSVPTGEPLQLSEWQVLDGAANVATTVYWGLWDSASGGQLVNGGPEPQAELGNWHFVIADNVKSLANAQSLGPLGQAEYTLSVASNLRAVDGTSDFLMVGSGASASVDFSQQSIAMSIPVDDSGMNFIGTASGAGSFSELYTGGIQLDGNAQLPANFAGAFAGDNAEALIGALTVTDVLGSGADFQGVMIFEGTPLSVP